MVLTNLAKTCWARRWRIMAALWVLWAVVLLMVYYKQLWRLFVIGPSAWLADNHSLAFVLPLRYLLGSGPSAWTVPALGEALTRALTAVFGTGLVLLAAQVLGISVCRLLRWYPDDWREGLLYRTAIGFGAVSYLSLGLAALGLYSAANVRILTAVVLLGGGLWFFYSRVRSSFGRQQVKALAEPTPMRHDRAGDRVWRAVVLLAVLIAFVAALAPEVEFDALWYHLWLPKLWLDRGRSVDIVAEYISLYPLTWELIFGAGMVWGGPVAAKLLHFACLPLTGLLTYQLTRRFMPLASSWLAVALFVTVPTVLWEATTAYIDLALAFHTGLVVYALLRYVERRRWQWLALAALNLGLALATKHLALFVLALAVSGLILRLWLKDRDLRRALVPAVLLGGLSLLLPLPWYVRNWFAAGNPFFPDLYRVFGAFPPERWNDISEYGLANFKNHFGDPRTSLNLLLLPWNITVHAARYGGTLGPMFLLLLPALALRRRNGVTSWLLAFVLLYTALWASPVSSFQMRFLVPIVPLLAVLTAESCGRLAEAWQQQSGRKVTAYGGMAVLLLLNLPPFTSLHETDRVLWDGWLTHVVHEVPLGVVIGYESEQDYLARKVSSYNAWCYINSRLPDDARVLTFSDGDNFYSERDRIPSVATVAQGAVWGAAQGQERQALQAMDQLGVSHVLFSKRLFEAGWMDDLAIAQPSVMAEWYELCYEDAKSALYRLRWEHLTSWLHDSHTTQADAVEAQTTLTPARDQARASVSDGPLVTQEIRYHIPEAGEVFLVWGINGWAVVPEENRPVGTVVKDKVMHTLMVREGDIFVAQVRVPYGTTIDYGFLTTRTRNGAAVEVWEADGDQDYHTIAAEDGIVEVQTALTLEGEQTPLVVRGIELPLLVGLGAALGLGTILIRRRDAVPISQHTPRCRQRLTYLRDLLRELVARDMKLRYKRSILGVAWSLLNPLFQILVFVFLSRRVLSLDIPNYPSFVFTGVLAWNWFHTAVITTTSAITGGRELVGRPGFPTAILPVVTVTTNLLHFVLALPVLLLFLVLGGGRLTAAILALPLIMVLQFLLILGLGYLVATVNVTFRDTQHLLGVFFQLLFFLTPVFYDATSVPARYQTLYRLNPMFHLIAAYRAVFIQGTLPDYRALLAIAAFSGGLLWLGHTIFTRASTRFVEEL